MQIATLAGGDGDGLYAVGVDQALVLVAPTDRQASPLLISLAWQLLSLGPAATNHERGCCSEQ